MLVLRFKIPTYLRNLNNTGIKINYCVRSVHLADRPWFKPRSVLPDRAKRGPVLTSSIWHFVRISECSVVTANCGERFSQNWEKRTLYKQIGILFRHGQKLLREGMACLHSVREAGLEWLRTWFCNGGKL